MVMFPSELSTQGSQGAFTTLLNCKAFSFTAHKEKQKGYFKIWFIFFYPQFVIMNDNQHTSMMRLMELTLMMLLNSLKFLYSPGFT